MYQLSDFPSLNNKAVRGHLDFLLWEEVENSSSLSHLALFYKGTVLSLLIHLTKLGIDMKIMGCLQERTVSPMNGIKVKVL